MRGNSLNGMTRRCVVPMVFLLGVLFFPYSVFGGEFVFPQKADDPLIYGIRNGIMVAVHPYSIDRVGNGGPRGLIRIGCEEDGKCFLFNFVGIEPLVGPWKGLSELDKGEDGQQGKPFRVSNFYQDFKAEGAASSLGRVLKGFNPFKGKKGFKQDSGPVPPGKILTYPDGRVLTFAIQVEPFANGARPVLEVSLFENMPKRVRFRIFSAGGLPMQQCTLTATMGNLARCRNLWLERGAVHSPALYPGFRGDGFAEKRLYNLNELHRTPAGDVVLPVTPDEFEPSEVWPLPSNSANPWHYPGKWMTQYWLKRKGNFDQSLKGRVNGRQSYWQTGASLPGGVAFENFEFRENFREGQEIWFGYTYDSPAKAFGFGYDLCPSAQVTRGIPDQEQGRLAMVEAQGGNLENGDFRQGLDSWEKEGDAAHFNVFQQGDQMAVSTYGPGKDRDQGRLFQCFRVPENARELDFFLHGGSDAQKVYVALWKGEKLLRKMTARDSNIPFEIKWDVSGLQGQAVTLEICDFSSRQWGFIGAHGFRFQ